MPGDSSSSSLLAGNMLEAGVASYKNWDPAGTGGSATIMGEALCLQRFR